MGTGFMDPGLSLDRIREITGALFERGTEAYCPALITGSLEVYERNLRTLAGAVEDPGIGGRILGIHLEGPFISPEPGAVGAHPLRFVRDPDTELFDRLQEWAGGNIRILTLAPERPGAEKLIRHASERGVIVSLGHHAASDDCMELAVEAGAALCTHVGNGIPNEVHRHHNPMWWQLACDDVSGLFITDGHHLPADLIKVALRAKTPERFVVTSDASPLGGMPPGKYALFDGLDAVIDSTGLISSEQSKSMAGSHSDMIECMNHLASLKLLGEDDLWKVGRDNALRLLGASRRPPRGAECPEPVFKGGKFIAACGRNKPPPAA